MIGSVVADRYEVQELLGSGGMASVYRAHDKLLERSVALKILHDHFSRDPEYVERFRREARSIARVSHPNIVTVIDRGPSEGQEYIVFEDVRGETSSATARCRSARLSLSSIRWRARLRSRTTRESSTAT